MADGAEAKAATVEGRGLGHVVAVRTLLGIWASLMVLTAVTVAVTYLPTRDLPTLGLWIAMGIATAKATLVALYFMHLRWDKPFHAIVFVTALLCVMLLVSLALMDTKEYQPAIEEREQRQMP